MALVGRYETYEQLGKGSTGTVYRARDTVLGREVALKILNGNSRFSSRLLHLFSTEAAEVPDWLHPNIARIYEVGESPVGPFVATELLTGAGMRSHIRGRFALSLLQKIDLLAQACDGLAHAHKIGIIHTAITPGSFFIDEKQHLRILDLGIRHIGLPVPVGTEHPGALDYLAPEQIWNGSCDARSDIFSAALVCYEFLVNVHPFAAAFVPRRIIEDSPPDYLRGYDSSMPQALADLLDRSLSRSPDDRPQTAVELAASLRAIQLEVLASAPPRVVDPSRSLYGPDGTESSINRRSDVKAFIKLLLHFDETLASGKRIEARQLLESMRALGAAPCGEQFAEAIQDCEHRLGSASSSATARTVTSVKIPAPHSGDVSRSSAPPDSMDNRNPSEPPGAKRKSKQWRFSPLGIPLVGTVVVAVMLLLAAYFSSQARQENPAAAWNALSLEKPTAVSGAREIKKYVDDLQAFKNRFPNSKQAHSADAETKRWEPLSKPETQEPRF